MRDQSCFVGAVKYTNLDNALIACLVRDGAEEIVAFYRWDDREEKRAGDLWPDQDWDEKVEKKWCQECQKWYDRGELNAMMIGGNEKMRKNKWFVTCPKRHEVLQTKQRIAWIIALAENRS